MQAQIVHRDIKPSNLFVVDTRTIKLGDMGLARPLEPDELCTTSCGTPFYISPEQIVGRPYSFPVDAWALGCVLVEVSVASTTPPQRAYASMLPLHNATPLPALMADAPSRARFPCELGTRALCSHRSRPDSTRKTRPRAVLSGAQGPCNQRHASLLLTRLSHHYEHSAGVALTHGGSDRGHGRKWAARAVCFCFLSATCA